jgi:hypothetical protein
MYLLYIQKAFLPALKSPIDIHFFLSIYYMILCFLLSMHKPLLLEIQTGLLWARKRQFVSPNTLHDMKPYWPFAVHAQAFSSGNRA